MSHNHLKRTNPLSIRSYNISQQIVNSKSCNPPESCSTDCRPSCSSNQLCVYKIVTECGTCPPTQCISKGQLQVSASNFNAQNNNNDDHKQTALVAGLTTGLVVIALVAATVAGFVFYRRRKLQKLVQEQIQYEKDSCYTIQPPPIIISNIDTVLPPPLPTAAGSTGLSPISETHHWHPQAIDYVNYDHPQSPFIIGAQSLQIPHLDTPDPSNISSIRRSLNIEPATTVSEADLGYLSRASSVKVTKYDHRNNTIPVQRTNEEHDDLEEVTTIRQAVSVKKAVSRSSSVTRVGSFNSENVKMAKPKMVRINTITRKEGGVTRKRSIRTVIDQDQQSPFHASLSDPPARNQTDQIDFYFCPPVEETLASDHTSQVSIQTSNSTSTLGDGEITVYWEPGQRPP